MNSTSSVQFVHRRNAEGEFISFCRECILTVGVARFEDELSAAERRHICDPVDLARIAQAKLEKSADHSGSKVPIW